MSLLLDARKKSQQAQSAPGGGSIPELELSLEESRGASSSRSSDSQHIEHARSAGQNLFDVKTHAPTHARASVNRNLLIALGGTVLLLTAGAGYVWYEISGPVQPLRPIKMPLPQTAPATPPQDKPVAEIVPDNVVAPLTAVAVPSKDTAHPSSGKSTPSSLARRKSPVHIEQLQVEPIDPILNDAYQAYLGGQFDRAQQLYLRALKLDARNADALLGLAAIAQRRGADNVAAHYYAQVLELDPRDAVANAGMAALTTGGNSESRLKTLLNEQQDSSALHFALGNRYAAQSRWADAQQSYFKAYKLEPGNAELAFNLAVSLDRLGQKKSAAQYYQRALELDSPKTVAGGSAGFDHAQISQRIEELTH